MAIKVLGSERQHFQGHRGEAVGHRSPADGTDSAGAWRRCWRTALRCWFGRWALSGRPCAFRLSMLWAVGQKPTAWLKSPIYGENPGCKVERAQPLSRGQISETASSSEFPSGSRK